MARSRETYGLNTCWSSGQQIFQIPREKSAGTWVVWFVVNKRHTYSQVLWFKKKKKLYHLNSNCFYPFPTPAAGTVALACFLTYAKYVTRMICERIVWDKHIKVKIKAKREPLNSFASHYSCFLVFSLSTLQLRL